MTKPKIELTDDQKELLSQVNDLSLEHPNQTFDKVAREHGFVFQNTPQGRLFQKKCRETWDGERIKA